MHRCKPWGLKSKSPVATRPMRPGLPPACCLSFTRWDRRVWAMATRHACYLGCGQTQSALMRSLSKVFGSITAWPCGKPWRAPQFHISFSPTACWDPGSSTPIRSNTLRSGCIGLGVSTAYCAMPGLCSLLVKKSAVWHGSLFGFIGQRRRSQVLAQPAHPQMTENSPSGS